MIFYKNEFKLDMRLYTRKMKYEKGKPTLNTPVFFTYLLIIISEQTRNFNVSRY